MSTLIDIYPLDKAPVDTLRLPVKFREWLEEQQIHTFADLRRHWEKLLVAGAPGFTGRARELLAHRMSRAIYCPQCGAPYILFDRGKLCEQHGPECSRLIPYSDRNMIRKAFPERISS